MMYDVGDMVFCHGGHALYRFVQPWPTETRLLASHMVSVHPLAPEPESGKPIPPCPECGKAIKWKHRQ